MRQCKCGEPSAYKGHSACRACYSVYQKQQRLNALPRRRAYDRERRMKETAAGSRRDAKSNAEKRRLLKEIKVAAGCIDCGYNAEPVALQFDHVRGTKLFSIALSVGGRAWHKTLAEMEKCEVRCANCHAIKTHGKWERDA